MDKTKKPDLEGEEMLKSSALYKEFLAEREESSSTSGLRAKKRSRTSVSSALSRLDRKTSRCLA